MYANYFVTFALVLASLFWLPSIQAAEGPPPNEPPLFTQAREAQNRGDWEVAITSYLKYLETRPTSTAALHNLSSVYLANKLAVRALYHLDQLIDIAPQDGEAYIKRGRAYALIKEFAKAEADFIKGVQLAPNEDSYFYRAQFWFDRGEFAKSELDFEEVIRQNPNFTIVHLQLAKAYINEKKYSQAVDVYTRGIDLRSHPNVTSDFLFFRGLVYEDLGQPEKALSDYNESIQLTDQKPQVICNRGRLLFSMGKPASGMADMNKALEMVPNYGLCYAFRSRAHYDADAISLAQIDAEKAVKFAPNEDDAYFARGLVRSKNQEYQLSIADYTKVLELNPEHFLALLNRAYDWALLKEYEKSDSDLEKALALQPKRLLTYTYLTDFYMRKAEYQRAVRLASRGLAHFPQEVELRIVRGEAYEALQQFDKALPDFELACKEGDKWGCSRLEWTRKALSARSSQTPN